LRRDGGHVLLVGTTRLGFRTYPTAQATAQPGSGWLLADSMVVLLLHASLAWPNHNALWAVSQRPKRGPVPQSWSAGWRSARILPSGCLNRPIAFVERHAPDQQRAGAPTPVSASRFGAVQGRPQAGYIFSYPTGHAPPPQSALGGRLSACL